VIDTHVHLDAPEFDADRAAVLAEARAAGVDGFVVPAVARSGFAALGRLAAAESDVYPAYGLHPMYLAEHADADVAALAGWLAGHAAVAVGECGLDFFVSGLDPERQRRLFDAQLRMARDARLPVIVHARKAVDEVTSMVRRIGGLTGVVHSFSGSRDQALRLIDLGFRLGFGGPLTYPRAQRLRHLVATLPAEALLAETDAPDQPLCGFQGLRNAPVRLARVVATMAELRAVPVAAMAMQLDANARALFRLPQAPDTTLG
jgi:TatD DNase family protein